ncbi:MAG: amino acid ABC transporter ATP-binding protein [Clostridia bacterium]|nr:amino acid ABC transporter ATP-binding protein [Clostridia bacterium]
MEFLKVSGICKRFGNTEVLRGVDFSLEKGEVLSIIGSSGSGKTTLLRCLNLLENADEGIVYINGEEMICAQKKYTDKEIREKRLHMGLVFQQFNLFPQYNVLDNLTLAPKLRLKEKKELTKQQKSEELKKINAQAIELLSTVGLSEKAKSYPCEISGGQHQRVAIARALMLKPNILCFDEPTSALDPELTGEVLKVIKNLKSGERTMVIVTHEMEFAKNVSDKVMFMADGVIEEMGTPEEVFDNPKSPKLVAFLNKAKENF